MKLNHRSAWYSPRGFANEGSYIYGTNEDMETFFDETVAGDCNCGWGSIKHHQSLENAKGRCEKQAKKDISSHRACQECVYISARHCNE